MSSFVPIGTPVLRYFLTVYGKVGLPLTPPFSTRNRLTFPLTLTFNLLCLFAFYLYGQFNYTPSSSTLSLAHLKPLYGLLTALKWTLYPVTFTLNVLHFTCSGPALIRLLDSPPFRCVSPSKRSSRLLFAVCLALDLSLYLTLLWSAASYWASLGGALTGASFTLILLLHFSLVVRLVVYGKVATLRVLTKIEQNLRKIQPSNAKETEVHIVKQFIYLAHLNLSLNRRLSLPLSLYLLTYSLSTVSILCYLANGHFLSRKAFSMVIFAFNLLSIAAPCAAITRKLAEIGQLSDQMKAVNVSLSLRLKGLPELYGGPLSCRLFSLFSLDFPFLWMLILFMVNYAVLINQTQ